MDSHKIIGKVKWFNTSKGYGFITTEDNQDIFVHYTDIISDNFRNLFEGDTVSFVLNQTNKGLRASEVVRLESE